MADGLLGSWLNPNTLNRPASMGPRQDATAQPPARTVEGQVMPSGQRAVAELPPQVNRVGPRADQALSQYQMFSGTASPTPGTGFSALV